MSTTASTCACVCERERGGLCNLTCLLCFRCETGFYGPRCGNLEFVTQPVTEEQIVATVFCVSLLLIGLAGALFFFYKW